MAEGRTAQRRVNIRSERNARYSAQTKTAGKYGRAAGRKGSARTSGRSSGRTENREHSRTLERNRARETGVGRGYVVFLAMISLLTVLMCVSYLRLKATVTAQTSQNEKLETTLATMKSENDALYENVNNDVDWSYIKDAAINRLGMKYAAEDQIVWYNTEDSSDVKQYEEVPAG